MRNSFVWVLWALLLSSVSVGGERNVPELRGGSDRFKFPFQNYNLSVEERVDDLVYRLTVEEIVLQMSRGGAHDNGPAPAVTRLGIKPFNWNTDCLRGFKKPGWGVGFPAPVGVASTFNVEYAYLMGRAIADETRANNHKFVKNGIFADQSGLSCFAPVVNIMRHPLWGRNQETYGEDPVLTGMMARSYVKGLQSTIPFHSNENSKDNNNYLGVAAVCKHAGPHSGPEDMKNFSATISNHDLGTTFLPSLRQCVRAGAHGCTCSSNAINGVPSCASEQILGNILRKKFKFRGYVISEEGAIESIDEVFNFTKTKLDTAVVAKLAGVDLELTNWRKSNRFSYLNQAVAEGLVERTFVQQSAKRLFLTRMKFGEFDPPELNPWTNVIHTDILDKHHEKLAGEIAQNSYVLLKNDGLLPLSYNYKRISIVGPFANNRDGVTGDYMTRAHGHYTSPAHGVRDLRGPGGVVKVASGCIGKWNNDLPLCRKYDSESIKNAITNDTQLIIVTLGTGKFIEAESQDRDNMNLPANQYKLLSDAIEYAVGRPLILLLYSGGPVNIDNVVRNEGVNAIFACHFPGQAGGVFADLLQGKVVPASRLPYTWYSEKSQLSAITNYDMTTNRLTYRYRQNFQDYLFPFGYGLSYTQFIYHNLIVQRGIVRGCEKPVITVDVSNVGNHDADEVYLKSYDATVHSPDLQLVAFERVHIDRSKVKSLTLPIELYTTAVWKQVGVELEYNYYLEPGRFALYVGGQQPDQVVKLDSNVLKATFQRRGNMISLHRCEK